MDSSTSRLGEEETYREEEEDEGEEANFIGDEEVGHVVADEEGSTPMDEDDDDDDDEEQDGDKYNDGRENSLTNTEDEDMEELADDSVQGFFAHKAPVYAVAIHPHDQHLVATGGGDDKLYLWRSDTGLTLHQLDGHSDSVTCVAFSSNGQYVASGGMDGKARVYVAVSGEFVVELEGPDELVWMNWHPKGNILLGGASDGTIWMWTVPNGICMRVFAGHSAPVTAGRFTPDGKRIVSVSEDSSFILWDPKTAAATIRLCGDDARFHTGPITSVAVNKENTLAITGCVDGTARLINLTSGAILTALDNHTESIEATGFCDVLPLAATGGVDATVSIWDVQTFHLRTTLIGHGGAITHLVWHKDSPLVTTCSADRTIRTWDARTGQCLETRAGHQDAILSLAITLDGQRAITGGDDGVALVFEL